MDESSPHQNGRYKMDYYKSTLSPLNVNVDEEHSFVGQWNLVPLAQHQGKEQQQGNAMVMSKKIMAIFAERDAALHERNVALADKKEAMAAREVAIQQRDKALVERDKALMERDNAIAAIQYRETTMNFPFTNAGQCGLKRVSSSSICSTAMAEALHLDGAQITDVLPIATITPEAGKSSRGKQSRESKTEVPKASKLPRRRKTNKMREDLNLQGSSTGTKLKVVQWGGGGQDAELSLVHFDESSMPIPLCSCTGEPHQCYKWGSGGWQSACCTTSLSMYPLPQLPNKRHSRVGGRKMSGGVFRKLLSRLAATGYDLTVPIDLKDCWAKHGTNRYIIIK